MKDRLMDYQRGLPKIDTHEHIQPEAVACAADTDILDVLLVPYNCDSLWSAGCTQEQWAQIMDKTAPLSKRFALLEPFLPHIRHTAFFRAVKKTLELSYGETTFSLSALERADQKLKAQLTGPHYADFLGKLHIRQVLSFGDYDQVDQYDDPLVQVVPTVSQILPRNLPEIRRLEQASGVCIHDLVTCLEAITALFSHYAAQGVKAIKFGSAYRRELTYGQPDYQAAEGQLQRVLNAHLMGDSKQNGSPIPSLCYEELEALDDYLTDQMLALARAHGFVVVFHTAMHAWNENVPARAHCGGLVSLIRRYPQVPFVLLHVGAPYIEEAVLLARYYPNVHLDLTWLHIISPSLAQQVILRILELVPTNKVFAFGGDYLYLQTLPGHLELAMENFAEAFSQAIGQGFLTEDDAKALLRQWYYDNPRRVYGLD